VVGLSLLGEARLVMRGPRGAKLGIKLGARSLYALRGEARWAWTHEIPPVKEERLSLTFRTLARSRSPTRAAERGSDLH
jgi:alkylated DNA repair dioxygenase AlkB